MKFSLFHYFSFKVVLHLNLILHPEGINTKVQIIFKGCNTLKTLLMHPKEKIPAKPCQDVVYQWTCSTENYSSTYIGESSRCLKSRVKEHSTSSTSTIFQHGSTCNHPKEDISWFKILDQDRKQVSREAIQIRRNNPALNPNIGKMNIPKIFYQILNTDNNSSAEDSTNSNNQPNPTAISSNRGTRATNLFN